MGEGHVGHGEGSSPLTRGKHALDAHRRRGRGLIPAHAGKTGSVARGLGVDGAHPRSRGENSTSKPVSKAKPGSSPLTRGKHPDDGADGGGLGLIPAHAGKTPSASPGADPTWAHPRSRGENAQGDHVARAVAGSSPLTRGKRFRVRSKQSFEGLIPAHAGKTLRRMDARIHERAHPRSRGENFPGRVRDDSGAGSSPLTRGKPVEAELWVADRGLIPAHAGKTFIWSAPDLKTAAHPRSRGENWWRPVARGLRAGSSPLTRGKLVWRVILRLSRRLIPAHAGKTKLTH